MNEEAPSADTGEGAPPERAASDPHAPDSAAPPGSPAAPAPGAPAAGEGGGPGDLALDPAIACDLLSDHGGNIVITDDGRVVFMNASEHLVELAHALDPDNADVKARMEKIEAVRRAREQPPT